MVNVHGGRDWSAATREHLEFLEVFSTQVKYLTTNPIYG